MKPSPLLAWLEKPGNSAVKLAKASQLDPPRVSRMLRGGSITMRSAALFERGTGGEVSAESIATHSEDVALIKFLKGIK